MALITSVGAVDGDSIECRFRGQFTHMRTYGIDGPELEQADGPESA